MSKPKVLNGSPVIILALFFAGIVAVLFTVVYYAFLLVASVIDSILQEGGSES